MKKYAVICYSVHNKEIASHDTFDNEDDAYAFLEKDAQNTYEEEMNNASEENKDSIDFTISDDGVQHIFHPTMENMNGLGKLLKCKK